MNLVDLCKLEGNARLIAIVLIQVVLMLVEAWLGKTEKVKSGSILELIWSLIKSVFIKSKGD